MTSISRQYIADLLLRDTIARKTRSFHLLTSEEIEDIYDNPILLPYDECDLFMKKPFNGIHGTQHDTWQEFQDHVMSRFNNVHPFAQNLLQHFHGKIVACGGSIARLLVGEGSDEQCDVDFYFVNENGMSEQALSLLLVEAISYLARRWLQDGKGDNKSVYVIRAEHVVTIYLKADTNEYHEYQFILRSYPSIGSILGGFDISPSMVCYDGYRITGTELGILSTLSGMLIVDTSRRSTSFEHRINKYAQFCYVIFPGLKSHIDYPEYATSKGDKEEIYLMLSAYFYRIGYYFELDGMLKEIKSTKYAIPMEDDILNYIKHHKLEGTIPDTKIMSNGHAFRIVKDMIRPLGFSLYASDDIDSDIDEDEDERAEDLYPIMEWIKIHGFVMVDTTRNSIPLKKFRIHINGRIISLVQDYVVAKKADTSDYNGSSSLPNVLQRRNMML
jgi:hypothetical protein